MADRSPSSQNDWESIADGLALWDEHKPQSAGDWIAVARRSVAAKDYEPQVDSPLFQALYHAVEALEIAHDALERTNRDSAFGYEDKKAVEDHVRRVLEGRYV